MRSWQGGGMILTMMTTAKTTTKTMATKMKNKDNNEDTIGNDSKDNDDLIFEHNNQPAGRCISGREGG